MGSLNNDVLGLVLGRVSNGRDRRSCSEVCKLWFTIEALTRTRVRVLDPVRLPHFLPRFPNLTSLVAHVRMSDQSLMFIGEFCPNLQTLDLKSSDFPGAFGDEGFVAAATGCRRLVEVSLLSTKVGDKGIMALQTYAKALAVLHLSFCNSITDTSLVAIGDMESISELQFWECSLITDNGLNLLSSGSASRSLRVLTVCNCEQITDNGFFHLRRMSRLEDLHLAGYFNITDVGGVAVSAISSLKKLDLSGQVTVSNKTLFAIAKGCRNLVEINLDGCRGITGPGVISLASSLPLERIYISGLNDRRELSPYHVVQIAKQCPSLKHMIVDKELKKWLSLSQLERLSNGFCRVEWV